MKQLIILLAVFMMSCTQQKVTDAEVIELLDNYFTALDVDNLESNMIDKYITDDYSPLFEPEAFHFTMPHFLPPNIIWAIIEFQLRHLLVVESEYKTHPFPGVHNSGFDGHLQ